MRWTSCLGQFDGHQQAPQQALLSLLCVLGPVREAWSLPQEESKSQHLQVPMGHQSVPSTVQTNYFSINVIVTKESWGLQ